MSSRERAPARKNPRDIISPTARLVFEAVEDIRGQKTQDKIAEECGFFSRNGQPMGNLITMLKQGKTRIPVDKIIVIAKAIGIDPVDLFEAAYKEYYPDTFSVIEDMVIRKASGGHSNRNEKIVLDYVKRKLNGRDVQLTAKLKKILDEAYE